jgi:hypothetical protein
VGGKAEAGGKTHIHQESRPQANVRSDKETAVSAGQASLGRTEEGGEGGVGVLGLEPSSNRFTGVEAFWRFAIMKGNEKVIAALNEALHEELTAINQYFLHSEMCENWGYERLSKYVKKLSIVEMKHAERLIERILFWMVPRTWLRLFS